MAAFAEWGLDAADQIALLGLPADTKSRALLRYGRGTPLPGDPELIARAESLLAIQHALHSAFPHNPALGALWITTRSAVLGERSPLEVMQAGGLDSIRQMLLRLTGASTW